MNLNNIGKKKLYYTVKGTLGCCISPLDEWIKWLLYTNGKNFSYQKEEELSLEEMQEYKERIEHQKLAKLFLKYKNKNCTEKEHDLVYNYMITHSIEKLMISKINEEELEQAKEHLIKLKKLSIPEVKEYILIKNFNYNNLSKIDAYLLHYISIYNYQRITEETSQKIIQKEKKRELNLRKSLHKDYGYFS